MTTIRRAMSGYDIELFLGCGFFSNALKTFFESKHIPDEYIFTKKDLSVLFPSVEVKAMRMIYKPHFDVHFEDADSLVFVMFFDCVLQTKGLFEDADNEPIEQDEVKEYIFDRVRISFQFQFSPIENEDGYIERIDLSMSLHKVDIERFKSLPFISFVSLILFESYFRNMYSFTEKTSIAPGTIQALEIKVFPQTEQSPAAVALYMDLCMQKGPATTDYYQERQKHPDAAICLIHSKNEHIVCAVNRQVYAMMARSIKQSYAQETYSDSGIYDYPIYEYPSAKYNQIGSLKEVRVFPRKGIGLTPSTTNALLVSVLARCKFRGYNADVKVLTRILPVLTQTGLIEWSASVDDVDVDVDWQDIIRSPFIVFAFASMIGAIAGGFFGMFLAGGLYTGIIASLQSYGIRLAENDIKDRMQDTMQTKASALGTIPRRTTIIHKRWDPFYVTHYQVVGAFEECVIDTDGILAYGGSTTGKEDIPVVAITPVHAVRNEGHELEALVYSVKEHDLIIDPHLFYRPHPDREDEFQLSLSEIEQRMEQKHIRCGHLLCPTHVYRRNNQIRYMKFEGGLYLTPREAGMLHVKGILHVIGYKMVWMKRKGPDAFYFRASADSRSENNLSNLPAFNPYEDE